MNILFNDLNIKTETKQALEALELKETTDIQHEAIPVMLENKDMIGQAQTGTGKTFAFAIPILEKIDPTSKDVQALIICPTRELVVQVYKEFLKLLKFQKDIRATAIYGGESYTKQFKALAQNPQIIVATPGRTIDHMERNTVNFNNLKILVLDEADEMLKMGFEEDLEKILRDTPKDRQTALFSATMPDFIRMVAKKYQKDPKFIKIEAKTLTVDKITQLYYQVKKQDRMLLMERLIDFYEPSSAIIFCNTKNDVDELSAYLQKNGYLAEALHGDLKQNQRDYVMGKFRYKQLKFLVATDVAARGLDISHVDYVFNYELPFEEEIYVHRIGRTGRAGKTGVSISLVYPSMRNKLFLIERFIKQKMEEKQIPTDKMIESVQQRNAFKFLDTLTIEDMDNDDYVDYLLSKGFSEREIIKSLVNVILPKPKTYPEIQVPQHRIKDSQQRTDRSSRNNRKDLNKNTSKNASAKQGKVTPKKDFAAVTLNVGKNVFDRPIKFIDYLKKHADIYPKNIGDVVINDNDLQFELHQASVKRLDGVENTFVGSKKLKFVVKRR